MFRWHKCGVKKLLVNREVIPMNMEIIKQIEAEQLKTEITPF